MEAASGGELKKLIQENEGINEFETRRIT